MRRRRRERNRGLPQHHRCPLRHRHKQRHLVGVADAARLLDQATFGATASDIAHVQSVGIDAYINEQLAYPPTQYTGYAYTPHTAPAGCVGDGSNPPDASSLCARAQYSPFQVQRDFFIHALKNPDQLRQRVAFALSQIMVVSSVQIYEAYGLADYQNVLLNDAFGNYRTLLQDVTLSPTMGHYLDMVNNDAPGPTSATSPNENYAREVLQLFSIGVVSQINPDGTVVSGRGRPAGSHLHAGHDRGIRGASSPAGPTLRSPARTRSGPTQSTSTARWWHSPITTNQALRRC